MRGSVTRTLRGPLNTVGAKRGMFIMPLFIPMGGGSSGPPPPQAPPPFRENASPIEIEAFRKDYWRYYNYHYDADGETFGDKLFGAWVVCFLGGTALGFTLGMYEGITADKNQWDRSMLPVIYAGAGLMGGAIPPLGAWWLYDYVNYKMKKD